MYSKKSLAIQSDGTLVEVDTGETFFPTLLRQLKKDVPCIDPFVFMPIMRKVHTTHMKYTLLIPLYISRSFLRDKEDEFILKELERTNMLIAAASYGQRVYE